jgi:tRNA(Arg) A34 adenosine deaminase TadA
MKKAESRPFMASERDRWMQKAIGLAVENVRSGRGGPFGALIVKENPDRERGELGCGN